MHTELTFYCPSCDQGFGASDEVAGQVFGCPTCETRLRIPSATALAQLRGPTGLSERLDGDSPRMVVAGRRDTATTPLEMSLPGQLGSLKAEVDRPTSNAMATTILGGLLVAIGGILFASFAGNGKSA